MLLLKLRAFTMILIETEKSRWPLKNVIVAGRQNLKIQGILFERQEVPTDSLIAVRDAIRRIELKIKEMRLSQNSVFLRL